MDKKKKNIIIIAIVIAVIGIGIGIFFITKNIKSNNKKDETKEVNKLADPVPIEEEVYDYKKKTLTKTNEKQVLLTFNSNGGKEVDDILVEQSELVNLPTPERKGYIFNGWKTSWGGFEMGAYQAYFDQEFTADWVPGTNLKTMNIKFDTNNLLTFADITLICDKPISFLPKYYNAEGYYLDGWYTDSGMKVQNGSILECKDITLYAKFEKEKKYSCPEGSTQRSFNNNIYCLIDEEPLKGCPDGYTSYNKMCLDTKDTKEIIVTCEKETIETEEEKTEEEGTYIPNGLTGTCVYHKYNDITNKTDCNNGKTWFNDNCYAKTNTIYNFSCPLNYMVVLGDKKIVKTEEPICVKAVSEQEYCKEGYEYYPKDHKEIYDGKNHCIKIVGEPTLEK